MARRASTKNTTKENTVTDTIPNFDEPTEVEQVNDGDIEGTGDQPAETNPDPTDFDVDAPEAEDVVAEATAPIAADGTKAAEKAPKEPTRPPVPEGKVAPVAFAKILTDHLRKEHPELGVRLGEDKVVAPQVVYSYIKNNGADSKFPFPAEKAEGRAAVVDADAALEWWDTKDLRVKASKDAKAQKDAAKAAKAAEKPATVTEAEAPTATIAEAE
jgi:hypothetical protein